MRAQIRAHFAGIMKKSWKGGAIRLDQRIFGIENIKISAAVVGIDNDLHAIANVVNVLVARLVVTDRKSTRLNSSHVEISYAVFCLKKKSRTRTWCRVCMRRTSSCY